MKRYTVLIMLVGTSLMCADPNYHEQFLRANSAYTKGNFQEAYEQYQEIPHKSAHVWYNMGNAAYQLGDYGRALVYWRRAERLYGIRDKWNVLYNIKVLKKQLFPAPKSNGLLLKTFTKAKQLSVSLVRSLSLLSVQILFLLAWFALFVYMRYWARRRNRFFLTMLFAGVMISGLLLVGKYATYMRRYGVIIREGELRSGPGRHFGKIGVLPLATEVVIKGSSNEYVKVKHNGELGWMSTSVVEEV